jgi:hypothetical protein
LLICLLISCFLIMHAEEVTMKPIAKILVIGCAGLILGACNGGSDDNNDSPSLPTNPLISATYQSCVNGVATRYQFSNENGAKKVAAYAAADCSGAALTSTETPFTFSIGGDETTNTGQTAWRLDITENGVTTYTLARLSGGSLSTDDLNLGAPPPVSSPGRDGTTDATRFDGVDLAVTYEKI